jgi:hypothetical protein
MATGDILNRLRAEKWPESVRINFSDFVKLEKIHPSPNNLTNPFLSAIFYERKSPNLSKLYTLCVSFYTIYT